MNYTHVNPQYVEPGQEAMATEFDNALDAALPEWASEMSEGYAWSAPLPDRDAFAAEAMALANHLLREYPDV